MPLQRLRRHDGDTYDQVHLYPTNADSWLQSDRHLVFATGPNSRFSSGPCSNPEPDRYNGFCHTKIWTIVIGPVVPPKTRHSNLTTFAWIKYLSSDRIMTWSVPRLCIISYWFTSQIQNCDATNIRCVTIEIPLISHPIWRYFTATQQVLVASQFWMREVKELLKLHNLPTDHVVIQSGP